MKKLVIWVMLLMFSSLVMGATVTRDMSSTILPNQELTVALRASNIDSEGIAFAVEDTLPTGLTIKDWNVQGSTQAKSDIVYRVEGNRFGWSFIPSGTSATITYTVQLPSTETSYTFGPLVWFDRSGMSPQNAGVATLLVTTQQPTTTTQAPVTTTVAPVTTTTMQEEVLPPVKTTNYNWLIIVVLLVIIAVVAYLIFKKKD